MICAINKENRSFNAIKLIRTYCSGKELLTLTTSTLYSILFYNSEIWLSTYLIDYVKHKSFVASAYALKMFQNYQNQMTSFYELHKHFYVIFSTHSNFSIILTFQNCQCFCGFKFFNVSKN